jgi:hypothetical protein
MAELNEPDEDEWHDIGRVSTEAGVLAILDPSIAGEAGDTWAERVAAWEEGDDLHVGNFAQLPLPEPWTGIVVNTRMDGEWEVLARFCRGQGGRLEVCALRIEIHGGVHDDEGQSGDG